MTRTHASSTRSIDTSGDYLDLVRRFPLRVISSEREFRAAGAVLDGFVGREDLTPGQRDYVSVLAKLMEDYEASRQRQLLRKLSPVELVRYLMEQNGMNTADLGQVLGSRGLASEVLNGNRGLSKTSITRLADRFRVDPGLFLDGHR